MPGISRTTASICAPRSDSTSRSGPISLMPTGVFMPVESMSMRVLIGMVQAFVRPGKRMALSRSSASSSIVMYRSSGQIQVSGAFIQPGQAEKKRTRRFLRHS